MRVHNHTQIGRTAVTATRPDWPAIVRALENDGLSRAEIARQAGTARSTITRLASGERRTVSYQIGAALLLIHTRDA